MLSIADFISKYENYTDEELFEVHSNITTYSNEAKDALTIVIAKNGGLENLQKRLDEKKIITNEIQRINREVAQLNVPGNDVSFLKILISSNILPSEKVNEIIDNKFSEIVLEEEDKKIKPRTILGSIFGGGIASIIGGVLWGLQMIYSNRIFVIFLIGLVLLCYGIIKFSTRQSKRNTVVVIATVIAVIVALLVGQALYEIIGYQR